MPSVHTRGKKRPLNISGVRLWDGLLRNHQIPKLGLSQILPNFVLLAIQIASGSPMWQVHDRTRQSESPLHVCGPNTEPTRCDTSTQHRAYQV
eukprot:1865605-Amphidinium_carterae.1